MIKLLPILQELKAVSNRLPVWEDPNVWVVHITSYSDIDNIASKLLRDHDFFVRARNKDEAKEIAKLEARNEVDMSNPVIFHLKEIGRLEDIELNNHERFWKNIVKHTGGPNDKSKAFEQKKSNVFSFWA